jgi:uncharacterized protein (DUF58 family)
MPAAATQSLLSPEFMAKLDRLDMVSRKLLTGKLKGERRSKRKGQSVEFADYRNYVAGDDLRFIDWNLYARLEKLFLKLFLEEEDLSVHILMDMSKSCDYGEPNKAFYIKQVAAALGYIALVNHNRLTVATVANGLGKQTPALRGRGNVARLIDFIEKLEPDGTTSLAEAGRQFVQRHPGKGVCILLGDFFDKGGFESGLRYLAAGRYDLYCVQILSPQEIDPDLQGDLKLLDLEDGDTAEVSISRPLIEKYKQNLNAYCLTVRQYLSQRGGTYLFTSTGVPFETLVLNYLRERGLLG